ncbi:MAG TPA: NAD(P)/FAD-dependent oxidoreductase [Polyangiaceae bacterium]|nr:NAD(P)/FAD-dependent oxidoreductase [Polyangiaceae bacterium]
MREAEFDAVVVGGGPAGLSAALVLGRCRRRVTLFDRGAPRNAPSRASHGFFTRDGAPPEELRRVGREQLAPYRVELRDVAVARVRRAEGGFEVEADDGGVARCRKLLLATGMRDRVPELPGLEPLLGAGVYHCPYCDGWEVAGGRLAAYAHGPSAVDFALGLQTWGDEVALFTGGEGELGDEGRTELARQGVRLYEGELGALEGDAGRLRRVVLRGGEAVECGALFLHLGQEQAAPFAAELGCEFEPNGTVKTGSYGETGVPGLFVAGDASRDLQWLVVAAAEGAKAAHAINRELRREACEAHDRGLRREAPEARAGRGRGG